jgi:autotransporter-associated beta strand protein
MGIGVNGNPSALISIASDSRDLTINGQYIAASAVTWDVGAGRTLTLNGALNNWFSPSALIKNGAGTATLTQMGNYTGATTVNGGTLNLADGDWVTGQPWNGSGATGTITVGAGATLSTSAGVTQIKNGLVLNGGTVSSRGNTYGFGNDTWGNLVLSSDISAGNSSSSTISSEIRLEGNRTISVGSGSNLTISGGIAISPLGGSPGITKTGDGILTLSGANSYNGATNINGGTLILQNSYNSSGFVISAGSTLDLNVASGNRDLASTTFSGAGSLVKTGSGSVVWGGSSATFALGAGSMIDVREGVFGGGSNANENWTNNLSGLNVASGATFNGVEANVRVDALTGSGTITSGYPGAGYQNFTFGVNDGSGNFSGTLADSDSASANFVKEGTGTQTLSGVNSYTGTTTINGGTLVLQGSGGGGTNYTGGNININGASTLRITGERYNFAGEVISFNSTGGGTIDALASGAGGTVFTGDNTIATNGGAQNVLSGVRVGAQNQGLNLNGQTVTFNVASGTDEQSDLKVTGTLWNSGNVIKTGDGRLELTGEQQYVGTTTVSGGSLIINGNISTSTLTTVETGATIAGSGTTGALTVNAGAFINPGNSPGILNTGDYSQAGTLIAEINGITAGTQHDQLNVTGSVTLSGALSLDTLNAGIDYVLNDVIFLILNDDSDAVAGAFSNYSEGATVGSFGGFEWIISYQADYDSNRFFNGNDVALRAVPEPSAALLGGLGALALLRRRRK